MRTVPCVKGMKKLYAIIASVLVIGALSVTVNWGYLGHLCGMAKDAMVEFSTDRNEAGQAFVAEVTNMSVQKILNPVLVNHGGGNGGDDDGFDIGDFPEVPKGKIKNLNITYNGQEFEKVQESFPNLKVNIVQANEKFRGDQFEEKNSFHAKAVNGDELLRELYVKVNVRCTAGYEKNLKGDIKNNSKYVDDLKNSKYKTIWEEMDSKDVRKSVNLITTDTVLQKVVSKDDAIKYIEKGWNTLTGCFSKAEDAAPFVYNIQSAYVHLRLDYNENPYKEVMAKKGEVYVLRCTLKEASITNDDYPTSAKGYPPPCTETGYTGSPEYLIPEYCKKYDPNALVKIQEGAIYCLNYDGEEKLIAVFDPYVDEGKFVDVGEFVKK